jgi:co-chaperonin GroES (HSP10)
MRLRPDLCLVALAPAKQTTASGLITAHSLPPAVCYGKVRQTGEHVTDVAVGDLVVFTPSAGEPLDGYFATPHLLIPEAEISAVLERT